MAMAQVAGLKPVELLAGDIELRLAENEDEIRAAQALRYRIFYEEMSAEPTAEMQRLRRDFDSFDDYCDHLLVIDRALPAGPRRVVGTYRLLRRAMAEKRGQFYSVDEYDIRQILAFPGEILELGRSCIEPAYRQRSIMQLMWRGIADYVMYHEIGLMFGCASLAGVDPAVHALALSYLHHHHLAPANLRPRALPSRYVAMNMMPRDQVDSPRRPRPAAAADQGLSAPRRLRGRRRRDRQPVSHHRCLGGGGHRPGDGQVLPPLHPGRGKPGER